MKSKPVRIVTPDEVIREFKLEPMTKEEALDFLYRAGIVTKKGNLRKVYRSSNTSKSQTQKPKTMKSKPVRIVTPDEVLREYKPKQRTKEEALDFLYRAGIVDKKGNLRGFYRSSEKSKSQNQKPKTMKSKLVRIVTPEEVLREYKPEPKTREEALDFLYRAGIVDKEGNYRGVYRSSEPETE